MTDLIARVAALDSELVAKRPLEPGSDVWDTKMERLIREFAVAGPEEKASFRKRLTDDQAGALWVWAERTASAAVRLRDPQLLKLGLLATSLSQGRDRRDALRLVPLFRRGAVLIDADPDEMFSAASHESDRVGAQFLERLRPTNFQPGDMGYVEIEDEHGFRFADEFTRDPARMERLRQRYLGR